MHMVQYPMRKENEIEVLHRNLGMFDAPVWRGVSGKAPAFGLPEYAGRQIMASMLQFYYLMNKRAKVDPNDLMQVRDVQMDAIDFMNINESARATNSVIDKDPELAIQDAYLHVTERMLRGDKITEKFPLPTAEELRKVADKSYILSLMLREYVRMKIALVQD